MNDDNVPIENIDINIPRKTSEKGHKKHSHNKKLKRPMSKKKKVIIIVCVVLAILGLAVGGFFLYKHFHPEAETPATSEQPKKEEEKPKYYSTLSGEEIADPAENSLPTFCVQIPNGMDGPRPQAGLNQAKIVFEAIAEAGITRFAAVFQNPTVSAIGPIRSLRPYYLEWDTPIDCTVVHAGGSYEALEMLKAGGYRDLTENYTYEYRDYYGYYAPNNLFTTSNLLKQFNTDNGFNTSDVKSFARLTPEKAEKARKKAVKAAENKTEKDAEGNEITIPGTPLVTHIAVNFGWTAYFNTVYDYDSENNVYRRSFADGTPHTTFTCPEGLENPSPQRDCGEPTQITPKAIAVMVSDQGLADDRYHQVIPTTGSGPAYVFQNGTAVSGTWERSDIHTPVVFKDAEGKEIKFVPGQLWVAAIPSATGSVEY